METALSRTQDLLDFLLAYGQSGPEWGGVEWIQNACNIVATPLEDLYTAPSTTAP